MTADHNPHLYPFEPVKLGPMPYGAFNHSEKQLIQLTQKHKYKSIIEDNVLSCITRCIVDPRQSPINRSSTCQNRTCSLPLILCHDQCRAGLYQNSINRPATDTHFFCSPQMGQKQTLRSRRKLFFDRKNASHKHD